MFHPVGPRAPSVYWRRRMVFAGALLLVLVLLVLTVRALTSSDSGNSAAAAPPTTTNPSGAGVSSPPSTASSSASASRSASAARTTAGTSATASTSASASATVGPPRCRRADLAVSAVVGQPSYKVGDKPVVKLQVVNTGRVPCAQDLADSQVELQIYNGESRVWGSHDCQIQPGTNVQTLAVGRPVQVSITWSGLTSQPHCAGTRQAVGAGTYTLYAILAGSQGKAARFSIS